MPTFAPTQEQVEIVNAALTGENVVVEAGAGSGKTSTLRLVAEALSNKSLAYIAFNSAVAREASGTMPMNVDARTAHSFAYRAVVGRASSPFGQRLNAKRPSSREVAMILNQTKPLYFTVVLNNTEQARVIKTSTIGYLATRMVERFCQSAESEIQAWMCPKIDGLDAPAQRQLADHILPLAKRVWADVCDPKGAKFKFEHSHYLKLFQLSGKPLEVEVGGVKAVGKYGEYRKGSRRVRPDIILYDEAQDASPVVQAIVQAQNSQVIVVGDRAQAIYGFTGAKNAMDQFNAPHTLKLTKSFRFGHEIAKVANRLLAMMPDTDMQIVGHDPVPSEVVGLGS